MATRGKRGGNGGDREQVEILRAIWNEMKGLNGRVDKTNDRLDAVRTELKQEISGLRIELTSESGALRQRLVESEVRLATATTALPGDVRDLSGLIRDWRQEHREERAELRTRVDRIERHLSLGDRT